jgi:hypothetical protein
VIAESATKHFTHALLVNNYVLRVEGVMQYFIFVEVREDENATAKYGHDFFGGERFSRFYSALDFVQERVALVLEVFCQSKLFGAKIGLRDDFAVKGIQIELV